MNAPLVKLGDVCEVVYGFPFNAEKFNTEGSGLPLIRIRNVLAGHSETFTDEPCPSQYHIHAGDILVGMDGDFNIAKWRSGEAVLNQRVCKLAPKESRILPGYLFHRMKQVLTAIWEKKNFVTVKHLLARDLDAVAFPLPPLAEQERIVAHLERTLGAIDAMEAKFREMAETAERHFRATLAESFAALSSTPAAKLGEVCEVTLGRTPPRESPAWWGTETEGIPWVAIGDMGKSRVLTTTKERVSTSAIEGPFKGRIVPKGTLLLSFKLSIGKVGVLGMDAVHNEAIASIVPKRKDVHIPYLLYVLPLVTQTANATHAVKGKTLNKKALCNLDLPLPSLAEQERVVARLERAEGVSRRVVALAQAGVAQCGVYRRAVLSEAFGGGGDE